MADIRDIKVKKYIFMGFTLGLIIIILIQAFIAAGGLLTQIQVFHISNSIQNVPWGWTLYVYKLMSGRFLEL